MFGCGVESRDRSKDLNDGGFCGDGGNGNGLGGSVKGDGGSGGKEGWGVEGSVGRG